MAKTKTKKGTKKRAMLKPAAKVAKAKAKTHPSD